MFSTTYSVFRPRLRQSISPPKRNAAGADTRSYMLDSTRLIGLAAAIAICSITCVAMICAILFFPKIKIGKSGLDTYWIITLVGALIAVLACRVDFKAIGESLIADTAVNPVKILALFISMTVLSVFLDELGFFKYLAAAAIKHSGKSQVGLFTVLYFTVAVLTVFTSNDIIILSFTPFICYFAKNAEIDPMPYLVAEFVAANTWSMLFVIGNPTNIYLATASGIGFAEYLRYSALPTVLGGTVSFVMLLAVFRKSLKIPIAAVQTEAARIGDKPSFIVGIVLLAVCTVFLAIGSYIGAEMWMVAVSAVAVLILYNIVITAIRKSKPQALISALKRTPYQLIPFVLSMFVMISVLNDVGVTDAIGKAIGSTFPIIKYGSFSFLASNLINNIPMSVLFSSILQSSGAGIDAIMSTVIGSNVGAFFTPIGALAGIMWGSVISSNGIKFGYVGFLKMGVTIAIPTLAAALFGVFLTMKIV